MPITPPIVNLALSLHSLTESIQLGHNLFVPEIPSNTKCRLAIIIGCTIIRYVAKTTLWFDFFMNANDITYAVCLQFSSIFANIAWAYVTYDYYLRIKALCGLQGLKNYLYIAFLLVWSLQYSVYVHAFSMTRSIYPAAADYAKSIASNPFLTPLQIVLTTYSLIAYVGLEALSIVKLYRDRVLVLSDEAKDALRPRVFKLVTNVSIITILSFVSFGLILGGSNVFSAVVSDTIPVYTAANVIDFHVVDIALIKYGNRSGKSGKPTNAIFSEKSTNASEGTK
ncbi:hypothetical protein BKA69DRAFT_1042665 [Paraphysoderma sedebokerense]|nr:hypothetical protein BKA69DRAFT_1042665 [Paraphysoderma sedebokerense]